MEFQVLQDINVLFLLLTFLLPEPSVFSQHRILRQTGRRGPTFLRDCASVVKRETGTEGRPRQQGEEEEGQEVQLR